MSDPAPAAAALPDAAAGGPVDPPYGWVIVGLTLVNQAFMVGILVYSFALFVVPWLGAFDANRGELMLVIFVFQIGVGLLSPFGGRLLDALPPRLIVTLGGLMLGIGLCGLSFATALWQITALYALLMPIAMVLGGTLSAQTLVGSWFTERRGLAIGLSAIGTSIGGFIFPLLTSWLLADYTWQETLTALGVLSLGVMLPLNAIVLRRRPPVGATAETGQVTGRHWTTGELLGSRMFWIPVVALVPINAAFGGIQFNLGAFVDDLGFGQDTAATLIAVTSLSMICGKFFFGALGDRVDHRKLYWIMAATLAGALALLLSSPGYPELLAAAVLQGLATGGVLPMMGLVYASRFGTASFGRILGLVNLFLMTGSFGSLFSGWMFDLTGSYGGAFAAFLVLLLPCAVAVWWLPPPQDPAG